MHAHVLIHHTRTTNTPHTNVIDYTHIHIHIHMYTSLIHTYIDTHTTILYTLHCTYIHNTSMHTWYTYALISYSIPNSICHYLICTVPYMHHLIYYYLIWPMLYTRHPYVLLCYMYPYYITTLYMYPWYYIYEHSLITISHICHTQAPYKHIDIWGINRPVII